MLSQLAFPQAAVHGEDVKGLQALSTRGLQERGALFGGKRDRLHRKAPSDTL
jgi:hypothetical protein